MIYICADDYGLNTISSMRIQECIQKGSLNKISVFPNFEKIDLQEISQLKNIRISLHINLVEGKCMSDSSEIDLLADESGDFRHSFCGLLKQNLFHRKRLESQLYKEIKAQVLYFKSSLSGGMDFCIDSHQHTHMIPAVFKAMIKVLQDEKIDVKYMRIPAEPVLPYIKTPSLYLTYSLINIIKQWLLKFLWQINKKHAGEYKINSAIFLGILFSGKMNEKRVNKILPKYIKRAQKDGKDIEVLFHPGYFNKNEFVFENSNIVFEKFYISENRKTEFDSVMKI